MIYVLIVISIVLLLVILLQKRQINYYNLISKNLSAMKVIQKMYDIIGTDLDAKSKMEELNNNIIETYDIKYSSLIMYDGNDYHVCASNIDEEYYNGIIEIVKENNIKSNVERNVSKYLTTSSDKTLLYKSAMERNVKSCMFIPIYNKKVYLGFLLLEDQIENSFDAISKDEISKLKNNLGVFLYNTTSQDIIENSQNIDKLTNVYNNIYLYTDVRRKILKFENTSLILMHFSNMEYINETYTRSIGNKLLINSINNLKDLLTDDMEIVRYSGTKFIVVMYGVTEDNTHILAERILDKVKNNAVEKVDDEYINLNLKMLISTIKKQANIETEVQKMINNITNFKEEDTIKIM